MDVYFDDGSVRGLRDYVRRVGRALGLSGECSCVEVDRPLGAYLALDGRVPSFPNWDVALLWREDEGWAVAVEPDGVEEPVVLARMGGDPVPSPHEVARWAQDFLGDGHVPSGHLPALV
ncbi:DUF6292 family protein [Umezawaea sp.]|uniref:DUF6292 family protein n=1 Tax=Umezawaea sp. TaxID=1955258 RepID=UPI002ED451E8